MSSGLLALLDDIAAIVKVTAASLDDIAAQTAKTGSKIAGVIIDDAAVTPKYVVGLSPKRELPIIWNIAKGSLKNKLFFLMPAALLLGWLMPWMINPILALGGIYLCFEGYEKIHHMFFARHHDETSQKKEHQPEKITPEELEKIRTNSAIRTDFILSAEIMAIAYNTVQKDTLAMQFSILLFIAIGITFLVYGTVGLIVKADDAGLHLAQDKYHPSLQKLGRAMVKGMPAFLSGLSLIGTFAMLWVGGGIIIHALPFLHHEMEHLTHALNLSGVLGWSIQAALSAILGLIIGFTANILYVQIEKYRAGLQSQK